MFKLGALAGQPDVIGLGVGELGLRLQHICFGGNASVVTVLRDGQRALIALKRAGEQGFLRIQLAQRQIIKGQFTLGRQAGGGQVGSAGLRAGTGAVHRAAQAAPHVRLPAGTYPELVVVAHAAPAAIAVAIDIG